MKVYSKAYAKKLIKLGKARFDGLMKQGFATYGILSMLETQETAHYIDSKD